jgi:hypothetical protein
MTFVVALPGRLATATGSSSPTARSPPGHGCPSSAQPQVHDHRGGPLREARHFARTVVERHLCTSRPVRIDVGQAPGGDWNLISAGPSWSADFLDANPSGVVASLLAAQQPGYDHWKWVPDEMFRRMFIPSYPARVS